jgi:hypothetical protein
MPLFKRFDGDLVRDVPATRAIMPYIMPQRVHAQVLFEQELDVTNVLADLERRNAAGGPKITLFQVYVHAAVKTLAARPRMNRFTAGPHLYQRRAIEIGFSSKKAMTDDAPMVVVKRAFTPDGSFEEHLLQLRGGRREGKSPELSTSDKEMRLFLKLPPPAVYGFVKLAGFLDRHNLLPKQVIGHDPLYCSMFIANLGSVGLDAIYHHHYEWGNCPIFAALGRVREVEKNGEVRKVVTVRYNFDERIEDGLYCARALDHLRGIVESWGEAKAGAAVGAQSAEG